MLVAICIYLFGYELPDRVSYDFCALFVFIWLLFSMECMKQADKLIADAESKMKQARKMLGGSNVTGSWTYDRRNKNSPAAKAAAKAKKAAKGKKAAAKKVMKVMKQKPAMKARKGR